MRSSDEIRRLFLKFFQERGHTVVESAPLVPDDPSLLFVNAGMVPFKDAFIGRARRNFRRAASVQKCLRVSGKHNDLEAVGPSPRHHTFFEMLGNFSFGDYFKREAIHYAWEFVTRTLDVDPDRLIFTVHKDDPDSSRYWQEIPGVRPEQILRMGDATNFWSMGDVGPCGPTSEIHYDWGEAACTCGQPNCSVELDNDCGRWLEIWNLVFMQYDQSEAGLTPLPAPGVDTGMGLERIVAVLQNARTNYDTDLFRPIMEHVRGAVGHTEEQMQSDIVPYRVLADHGRAFTFLLADGVVPGNEKQKYVLRMIMRRALRFGAALGLSSPFLAQIAQAVIERMGGVYPELVENRATILKWAEQEEKLFNKTLDRGLDYFEGIVHRLKHAGQTCISGEDAFYLHDTLGFPIEVTEDLARERGLSVDRQGFEREMAKQRERSKIPVGRTTTYSVAVDKPTIFQRIRQAVREMVDIKPTDFLGYRQYEVESKLIIIISINQDSIEVLRPDEEGLLSFQQTPFYAEGGGQVADVGVIKNKEREGVARVFDVKRDEEGIFYHQVRVQKGEFQRGDQCILQIDVKRRKSTMRNHTATHILHAALLRVVGGHARQAGSLVAPDELRFDFTHFEPLTEEQIAQIEEIANRVILSNLEVRITHETLEEAKARGAMALFTEDYQGKERVRVVSILEADGSPFSVELCGGTHVKRTGEIGGFKILSEESVAAGVRRVRVATGENLLGYLREQEALIHQAARLLEAPVKELLPRLQALLQERDRLVEQNQKLRDRLISSQLDALLGRAERRDDFSLLAAQADFGGEDLERLADRLSSKLGPSVVLLGSAQDDRVQLVCKVTPELTARIKAGEIIRKIAPLVGGGGGGAAHFAQGGGSRPEKLAEALKEGMALIRGRSQVE